MSYVDVKYIRLLSARFRNFKEFKPAYYRCSCPVCGDSKKKASMARFYFIPHPDGYFVKCHNCQYSKPFYVFLKFIDELMFREYTIEKFGKQTSRPPVAEKQSSNQPAKAYADYPDELFSATRCDNYPAGFAVDYLSMREIPKSQWHRLYYAKDFPAFVKEYKPEYKHIPPGPRLVMPMFDREWKLLGIQGRAMKGSSMRYITLKDENVPKIFGLEQLNLLKTFYVPEGPIDSLFLSNAVAMAGASLSSIDLDREKAIFVFDNEPRNKEIISSMERTAEAGYRVCIWPISNHEKDINDMVRGGKSPEQVENEINTNSYRDIEFKIRLQAWRKC